MSAAHSARDCASVEQCLVVNNSSITGPMNFGGAPNVLSFGADVRNMSFAEWLETPVARELLSRRASAQEDRS